MRHTSLKHKPPKRSKTTSGKKLKPAGTKRKVKLIDYGFTGILVVFMTILVILEFVNIFGYTYQWWREVTASF
jgi:hypothetical protein